MVPLFSAEGLSSLVFIFIVLTTVLGAVIATNSVRLIRAVTGLAICFIGVAGLYYYLNSPFVALMEMLIYVGAVCVTIVFAVMLADPNPACDVAKRSIFLGPLIIGPGPENPLEPAPSQDKRRFPRSGGTVSSDKLQYGI